MRKLITLAVLTLPALGQDIPKPGPEHDLLKERVGTWETTFKAEGKESKGSVNLKMDLGGLWLAGEMDSELFGMKFTGRSLDSYHPAKKKYVSVWVDSWSTAPVIMEGTYDKKTKTMTMAGEGPGMEGKMTKYRSETKTTSKDDFEMKMWIGDGKEPMFTILYKRKKK